MTRNGTVGYLKRVKAINHVIHNGGFNDRPFGMFFLGLRYIFGDEGYVVSKCIEVSSRP